MSEQKEGQPADRSHAEVEKALSKPNTHSITRMADWSDVDLINIFNERGMSIDIIPEYEAHENLAILNSCIIIDRELEEFVRHFKPNAEIKFAITKSQGERHSHACVGKVRGQERYLILIPLWYLDQFDEIAKELCKTEETCRLFNIPYFEGIGTGNPKLDPEFAGLMVGQLNPSSMEIEFTTSDHVLVQRYISLEMSQFIMLHELAHIINGHLRYNETHRNGGGHSIISEAETKADEITMVLEWDADSAAARWLNDRAMFRAGANFRIGEHSIILPTKTAAGAHMLSVYATLSMFYNPAERIDGKWPGTHPPSALRAYYSSSICVQKKINKGEDIDEILEQFSVATVAYERTYIRVVGNKERLKDLDKIANEAKDFSIKMHNLWNGIFNDIDKLKLGGNLAPPHYPEEPVQDQI